MQTFCAHRTRLVNESRALSFAKMVAANADFTNVEVKFSPTAKGERRFFVSYVPTNPQRAAALRSIAEDARDQRAQDQRENYLFVPDCFGRGFHDCVNLTTGESYEVSAHTCTCPDFHYRGSQQNPPVPCKHMRMLALELEDLARIAAEQQAREAQLITSVDVTRVRPDRAEIARRITADFGDF